MQIPVLANGDFFNRRQIAEFWCLVLQRLNGAEWSRVQALGIVAPCAQVHWHNRPVIHIPHWDKSDKQYPAIQSDFSVSMLHSDLFAGSTAATAPTRQLVAPPG